MSIWDIFRRKCPSCKKTDGVRVIKKDEFDGHSYRNVPETKYETRTVFDPNSSIPRIDTTPVTTFTMHTDTIYRTDYKCSLCGRRWSERRTVYG